MNKPTPRRPSWDSNWDLPGNEAEAAKYGLPAAPPEQEAPLTDERTAFEKWASERFAWTGPVADVSWIPWQARAALAASPRPLTEPETLPTILMLSDPMIGGCIDGGGLGDDWKPATLSAPLPLAESRAAESEPTDALHPKAKARNAAYWMDKYRECADQRYALVQENEELRAKLSQESRAGSAESELRAALDLLRDWVGDTLPDSGDSELCDATHIFLARFDTLEASKGSDNG